MDASEDTKASAAAAEPPAPRQAAAQQPLPAPPWRSVSAALADERRHIDALRSSDERACRANPRGVPIGLALSGGGIRSATFGLGVLQALAHLQLLRRIDYLSTVSGGGYIGSWLSAVLHRLHERHRPDALGELEQLIAPRAIRQQDDEPAEIRFLRAYSNYLTPRLGLFSADTLAALTGFVSKLVLNLLLAVVSIATLMSLLHIWILATHGLSRAPAAQAWTAQGLLVPVFIGCLSMSMLLTLQSIDLRREISGASHPWLHRELLRFLQHGLQWATRWLVLLPLTVALMAGGIWLGVARPDGGLAGVALLTSSVMTAFGAGALLAYVLSQMLRHLPATLPTTQAQVNDWLFPSMAMGVVRAVGIGLSEGGRYLVAALACGLVGWVLLGWVMPWMAAEAPVVAFRAPVMALVVLCVLYMVWVGVTGNTYSEFTREWLSRLVGTLLGLGLLWTVAGGITVHARPMAYWLWTRWQGAAFEHVAAAGAGIAVAWAVWRRLRPVQPPASSRPGRTAFWVDLACAAVVVGVMAVLSVAVQEAMRLLAGRGVVPPPAGASYADLLQWHMADVTAVLSGTLAGVPGAWTAWTAGTPVFTLLLATTALALLAFRYIDVNTFALQNLYRNRLVRCYLGAAHQHDRLENPYAGFDPKDDLALEALEQQRPYHLVNAALNLTQGEDLAWQQRKAASFVFTPRWCGFWIESTEGARVLGPGRIRGGYARTALFAPEPAGFRRESPGVMLGTAMATSGAALSSQMGFASKGLLAFVLTLMNLRLGRWFPNPASLDHLAQWRRNSPRFAAAWYLRELLGRTHERADWVYLSDGGHFENLGLYELVRRRCRFIISVDAGADPATGFGDLGNAVRKCRVDFGVEIDIDLAALKPTGTDHRPDAACTVGTIDYPEVEGEPACKGRILYIKPCLPRQGVKLTADIVAYAAEQREFPHQPTTDQWFTEAQFESYRQLGFRIAMHGLRTAEAKQVWDDIAQGRL